MSELQRTDGALTRILTRVLGSQCRQVRATGGVILRSVDKKNLSILATFPPSDTNSERPKWISPALDACLEVLSVGNAAIVPPSSQQGSGAPSRSHAIIAIPIKKKNSVRAVAAFLVPEKDPRELVALKEQLKNTSLLLDHCELILTLNNHRKVIDRLSLVLDVMAVCNQARHFASTAVALCNALADKLRCHRVSLGVLEGRYVRVHAISRTETFRREMKLTQDIEAAMEECLDQDVEIMYPAEPEATFVQRAARQLSEQHGPAAILTLPIRRNSQPAAVLLLERPVDHPFADLDEIEAVRLTCDLCAPRLMELRAHDRWFGARLAAATRKRVGSILGPRHIGLKLGAGLVFLAALFLVFAKGDYRIDAPFVFEAAVKQSVVAPFDSFIKRVAVDPGQTVEADRTILGELESADQRLQLAALKAEQLGHRKQRAAAMRDGKTSAAQMAEAQIEKLAAQIRLIERHIEQATLVAPVTGRLVSEDLKHRLGAPVEMGAVLFEFVQTEQLRAELFVPEESILLVNVGQSGELAAVGRPNQKIRFVIERIHPIAEVVEQQNSFRVRAGLLNRPDWIRPGMEGQARIEVGRRHYAWIWTHRVTDWLRMKLWL